MSDKKIKVLIVLLFLIAGFAVTRLALVFDKYLQPAKATAPKEKLEEALGTDVDKDGIPDAEEAYYRTDPLDPDSDGDGFLDGEEIVSSCDPTIKGPDDCRGPYTRFSFEDKEKNFTDELASIIVSGIYSGDLKPESKNFSKSLDALGSFFMDTPISDGYEPAVKINNSATETEKQKYFSDLNKSTWIHLVNPLAQNPLTSEKLNLLLEKGEPETDNFYSLVFHNTRIKIESLEIPIDYSLIHKDFISLLNDYELAFSALINSQEDPLKAIIALNKILELDSAKNRIVAEYSRESDKYGILPENNAFKTLKQ